MNTLTTWFAENKLVTALSAFFLIATGVLGTFTYFAWDGYASAQAEYSSKTSQLANLSHRKVFPNDANLTALRDAIAQEESDQGKLIKMLQGYEIAPFAQIDKDKIQNMPQQFQDALRTEVTRIKSLAAENEVTLPPGFYLGLEEYENRLPQQEETVILAKQLTILSWMAQTLVDHKGLVLEEFKREQSESERKKIGGRKGSSSLAPSKTNASPYQTACVLRMRFRCNQSTLRDVVNALSTAPYFLLINGMEIQNTVMDPPRRDATPTIEISHDDPNQSQRLPIIVGRESLNAMFKILALEFQAPQSPVK